MPRLTEVILLCLIVVILSAIAVPILMSRQRAEREATDAARDDSLLCLKNMIAIAEGTDRRAKVCPRSAKPYRLENLNDREVLSCPRATGHLPYDPRFERVGGQWVFHLDLPAAPVRTSGAPPILEEPIRVESATLRPTADGVLIKVGEVGATLFVFAPVFLLLAGLLCLWAFVFPFKAYQAVKGFAGTVESVIARLTIMVVGLLGSMLFASGFLAVGLGLGWICFRGLTYSQEIAISRESREVVIQDFYFGRPWKDPIRIPHPRVFYPYNGSTLAEVILIHGEREALEHRSLFTLDRKDVGLVSVLRSGG